MLLDGPCSFTYQHVINLPDLSPVSYKLQDHTCSITQPVKWRLSASSEWWLVICKWSQKFGSWLDICYTRYPWGAHEGFVVTNTNNLLLSWSTQTSTATKRCCVIRNPGWQVTWLEEPYVASGPGFLRSRNCWPGIRDDSVAVAACSFTRVSALLQVPSQEAGKYKAKQKRITGQ